MTDIAIDLAARRGPRHRRRPHAPWRSTPAAIEVLGADAAAFIGQPVGEAFDVRSGGGRAGPARRPARRPRARSTSMFRRPDGTDVPVTATIRVGGRAPPCSRCGPSGERSGIAIISTVTHELRSPLTSVKGYTSLMLSRWDRLKDEQKRTMLEQVHHDADRVTRLVTELLDISRLETGRLVLRRQLVDLPGPGRVGGREGRPWASPSSTAPSAFAAELPRGLRRPRQGGAGPHQPGRERRQVRQPEGHAGHAARSTARRWPSRCATRRGDPGRGPARVFTVLPARPRPAHRHRARAVDQPGPGRGPRRAAHRRLRRRARAARSASPCPSDAFERELAATRNRLATPPPEQGASLRNARRHRRHRGRRGAADRGGGHPRRPARARERAARQEVGAVVVQGEARRARPRRAPRGRRRRSTRRATRSRPRSPAGAAELEAVARREQLAGRAARPHRGAARPRRRPPPPRHPGHGDASRTCSSAWASPSPRAPRSRPTGTTSARSTSRPTTRPATCTTRSTSTWASPARRVLRTHTSPVQVRVMTSAGRRRSTW